MTSLDRMKRFGKAVLTFIERMEAGSTGYVEHCLESLTERVMDLEQESRSKTHSSIDNSPGARPVSAK